MSASAMGLASTTGFVSGAGTEPPSRAPARVDAHERRELSADWQATRAPADLHADTAGIEALDWIDPIGQIAGCRLTAVNLQGRVSAQP